MEKYHTTILAQRLR